MVQIIKNMSLPKKAWLLLNQEQKKYAIFIFILMFVAMILESLSIGILIPLISILLKGDVGETFFSYFFIKKQIQPVSNASYKGGN